MLSSTTSNQSHPKSKKVFQKEKNKPNQTSKTASEITSKFEKAKITQSNKNVNFLNQTTEAKDTNSLNREKPGLSFQDFPELKAYNNSSLSKFNKVNSKIGLNNLWNSNTKKNELLLILTPVNNETKTEGTPNAGKSTTSLDEINLELLKVCLKDEGKEKEVVSVKEFSAKSTKNPNKKKRADPVFINLGDILNRNKSRRKKGRPQKFLRSKFQRFKDTERLSGNFLDSSNPRRLRGKYREVKKEKLTNLKLTIIKERVIKQKLREESVASFLGNESVNFIDNIDFKAEVKLYLKEQNERKLKQTTENKDKESSKNGSSQKNIKKNERTIPLITPQGQFKFSSKFRMYCDNIITPELNSAISNLIKESVSLQDRAFLRDPVKAKARRRHVSGIREVKKYLIMKKVKLIVIAPNLENLQMEGSLHDLINEMKAMALEQNVPYAFALDRYKIGRCTKKNIPVSAFAILTCDGIEGLYHHALDLLKGAKQQFSEITKPNDKKEGEIKTASVNSKILASLISAFKEELKLSDEKNNLAKYP